MKTKQFCAVIQDGNRITIFQSIGAAEKFRNNNGGFPFSITHESSARVHGSFGAFLATQQHNVVARKAFLSDLTNHANPEPESLSVEVAGHFIPIY